jgi:glycosyltransferase involved in cell wall biosynthesis
MAGTRVVYWNTIPSPYVVQRFNRLMARGNLELSVWFTRERDPDRSWNVEPHTWSFPFSFVNSDRFLPRWASRDLARKTPDVFVSLYHAPAYLAASAVAKAAGSRTTLRVLPTFGAWRPRSKDRELMKRAVFRSVDAVKVPGPDGARYAARYGVPHNRMFTVTQSIDVEHYASARCLDRDKRDELRAALGLSGCTFIYVGRLWQGKGVDNLLDAYQRVVSACPDVSLLIVGDGVDEARFKHRASTLPNVAFAGFVQPSEIPMYYGIADIFVFPTLGDPHGLVIDEAMAAGLPVITSAAAGDVSLRLPHEAGRIVPPGNPNLLAEAMIELASSTPEERRRMGETGHSVAALRSHDMYAVDFERFVERTLSLPPRRSLPATSFRVLGHGARISAKLRSAALGPKT